VGNFLGGGGRTSKSKIHEKGSWGYKKNAKTNFGRLTGERRESFKLLFPSSAKGVARGGKGEKTTPIQNRLNFVI